MGGGKSNRWAYLFLVHGRFLTFWPDVFEPRPLSLEVSCSCGISSRDGPAAVLSGWSAAPLSGPPACCRSARCRSCRCAHPRRGVPSPAARSGQHDKVRRALCKCALWVPLSPAAAILLTAGTWSCRPLSSLDRIAGRSNLLKFCGPLQVAGERPGQYEDLLPALSAFLHFAGAKRPGSGSMTRLGGPRILFRQVRASHPVNRP